MKASLTLAFALLLMCTGTGAALADTPDGTPPSGETVCDGQTGAAYGLCTAFCEAMDCDSGDPQASQTACDKVGAKFLRITGQAPPCVVPVCPCISEVPDFIEALNGEFGLTSCQNKHVGAGAPYGGVELTAGDGRIAGSEYSPTAFRACGFFYGDWRLISLAEFQACDALIRAKAAEAGLTCTP